MLCSKNITRNHLEFMAINRQSRVIFFKNHPVLLPIEVAILEKHPHRLFQRQDFSDNLIWIAPCVSCPKCLSAQIPWGAWFWYLAHALILIILCYSKNPQVKDYDSISRLDQWLTTILLRIKKSVGGDPDLRWVDTHSIHTTEEGWMDGKPKSLSCHMPDRLPLIY